MCVRAYVCVCLCVCVCVCVRVCACLVHYTSPGISVTFFKSLKQIDMFLFKYILV